MLPPGQLEVQLLLMHAWPALHALPQPPQLAESSLVFEQLEPQSSRPEAQLLEQTLFTQAVPDAQTLPHFPQLELSETVLPHEASPPVPSGWPRGCPVSAPESSM
jgi:hypothetical protein